MSGNVTLNQRWQVLNTGLMLHCVKFIPPSRDAINRFTHEYREIRPSGCPIIFKNFYANSLEDVIIVNLGFQLPIAYNANMLLSEIGPLLAHRHLLG